ncbi:Sulfotransferase family protein [Thermomonospora echinospora]|uniref:Sulfotransferase family protein n=1 Tax=Thermomonospora echinospora TaxID=1992 RepID=A0A1H6DZX0_9ACTN|nr:sulfotransferase [Thermomonospora echinospora]SEG90898.1 Sulfotransferase family protein [Thermomonospora echinospora]
MVNAQRPDRAASLRKGLRRRSELLAAAVRPPGRGPAPLLAPSKTPRLVPSPVFVLSCQRSGSTLLRVLLNSHSRIRAPHELHLKTIQVRLTASFAPDIMGELGLDQRELEHLLWDRILHHELHRSGKSVIVEKTPSNSYNWRRIQRAWPQARFVFLLRNPATIVGSVMNRRGGAVREDVVAEVLKHAEGVESAREHVPGLTVRYEDLTADPERETRRLCEFLEVEWEPGMLDYGKQDHGPFKAYFGDWSSNIKSGRIQPAREPAPDEKVPAELADIARAWGYLD